MRDVPLSEIALVRFIPPPTSVAPYNGGAVGVLAIYLKKEFGEFKSLDIAQTMIGIFFMATVLRGNFILRIIR
ncbi:MAG TPA: hypothetical protein VK787_15645 [Puia sp.]|nr:hypothetical protein [Puia sp.]